MHWNTCFVASNQMLKDEHFFAFTVAARMHQSSRLAACSSFILPRNTTLLNVPKPILGSQTFLEVCSSLIFTKKHIARASFREETQKLLSLPEANFR